LNSANDECNLAPGRRPVYRIVNTLAAAGLAMVLLILALATTTPSSDATPQLWGHRLPPTCLYRAITGRPCPGCGTTRGIILALDGDWMAARTMHPSSLWVLAWLLVQLALRVVLALRSSHPSRAFWISDAVVTFATFLLASYGPLVAS